MRLRNKKTGEVVDVESIGLAEFLDGKFGDQVTVWWKEDGGLDTCRTYKSLAELNEEWEDYEEPKKYWYIGDRGEIFPEIVENPGHIWHQARKEIGNYFETEEEAKKAVERLKAYKRLKDKGFKFTGWGLLEYAGCDNFDYSPQIGFSIPTLDKDEPYGYPEEIERDLDLLFGGEK